MKIFYTRNLAGIEFCPRCNSKGRFPLTIEGPQENNLYMVYTKCLKCKFVMHIKDITKKEVNKIVGNRGKKA